MRYEITSAASAEPLTNADVKPALGLATDNTAHDDLLDSLIVAARQTVERYTNHILIEQTWRASYDLGEVNMVQPLKLYKLPIQSIDKIEYSADDETTWTEIDSDNYRYLTGSVFGEIALNWGYSWPYGTIRVTFTAGYGEATDVPENIKTAIRRLVALWFESESDAGDIPDDVKVLLGREHMLIC